MVEEKPENILAKKVLDEAFRVHTELGPGLLESVYEQVLAHRLQKAGHRVDVQKPVSIEVEGLRIPDAFRADLVIDDLLIIDLKSVDQLKKRSLPSNSSRISACPESSSAFSSTSWPSD